MAIRRTIPLDTRRVGTNATHKMVVTNYKTFMDSPEHILYAEIGRRDASRRSLGFWLDEKRARQLRDVLNVALGEDK